MERTKRRTAPVLKATRLGFVDGHGSLYEAARRARAAAKRADASISRRFLAFCHALSPCISAATCTLLIAAWISAAPLAAARTDANGHERVTATVFEAMIDIDFDGRADLANPSNGFIRTRDAYGVGAFGAGRDGGRRRHMGVDYVAAPGALVHAPLSGRVTRRGHAYRRGSGLDFLEIHDVERDLRARVFYVSPVVTIGQTVVAGDAIGVAQNLSVRYPRGITNHVHVELINSEGRRIDPSRFLPLPRTDHAHGGEAAASARPAMARR